MAKPHFFKDINRVKLIDGRTVANYKVIARAMTDQKLFPTYTDALDHIAKELYGQQYCWTTLTVRLKKENNLPSTDTQSCPQP